jgi:hypothetical protein
MADTSILYVSPLNCCHPGQRLKNPVVKKNAYAKSFVPTAVSVLNESFKRSSDGMRVFSEKYGVL